MRVIQFSFFLCILACNKAISQQERIHLSLDKYSCRAGDTVWFKAYTFTGRYPTAISTNLYVELFTSRRKLLSREIFPLFSGFSLGEVKIPDTLPTGNYYIRAFTRFQLNFDSTNLFLVPVTVYNDDKPGSVVHKKEIPLPDSVTAGYANGIYWATAIKNGYIYSLLEPAQGIYAKKLRVEEMGGRDSVFLAEITLDTAQFKEYHLRLPLDTAEDMASLLLYEDSILVGRQYLQVRKRPVEVSITPDTLDISINGYNSWEIGMSDTMLYSANISVTDADLSDSPPSLINNLMTSHIYRIKAKKNYG